MQFFNLMSTLKPCVVNNDTSLHSKLCKLVSMGFCKEIIQNYLKIYLSLVCCWWKNGVFLEENNPTKSVQYDHVLFSSFWINSSPRNIHFLSILCVNEQTSVSGISKRNFSHGFIGSRIQLELIERNIFLTREYSFPQHTLCKCAN